MNFKEERNRDINYASKGVANAGLTTGIIGTALGVLNGGLGNFGWGREAVNCGCSENNLVNRYELSREQEIADLQSQIALRDANIYNDQKAIEMYKYVDGRFREFEAEFKNQAVLNQATKDSVMMVNERLNCETKERKCADNAIVNYANATFYPKMVADVTTGTTTTAQTTYNPLPCECCG